MTAAVPFEEDPSSARRSQPFLKSAYGPSDAAWFIAEWLMDELANKGILDLIECYQPEFQAAFADSDYDIEPTDQFLTLMVLYLMSPFGTRLRQQTPFFSIAFEIWLGKVDPLVLSALADARQICFQYERSSNRDRGFAN